MTTKKPSLRKTSSSPFDFDNDVANEFFDLYGRILIAWAGIERSVDLFLFTSGIFQNKSGKGIINWSVKHETIHSEFAKTPAFNGSQNRANKLLQELDDFAPIRHTLVHGYFSGISSETPPKVLMRKTRYNSEGPETHELQLTIAELQGVLEKLQILDAEFGFFLMASITSRNRPPSTENTDI